MHKHMKAHSCNLRKGRCSEKGRIYLVTTVTREREPLFSDLYMARHAINALRDCEERGLCQSLAFVLMPDHLHWLFRLQSDDLSALIGQYKARAAAAVNRYRQNRGVSLWQPGYHDHALRNEEDLAALARYVVSNPLRAGLVDSVASYPHWDAVWLT